MHTHKRILIIDDEPLIRSLIEAIVKKLLGEGYDVLLCSSAESGIREIAEVPFDLIITDHDCAPGNGGDVIKAARAHQPLVPVILISGGSNVHADHGSHGADAFLAKPFPADLLIKTAHELFSRPRTR